MSEPNGPVCPECGTPRAADGTPACSCTHRASEARREARTAEAAAAEDFDPVRIRPFVELGDDAGTDQEEVPREPRELANAAVVPTSPDPSEAPSGPPLPLDADARESARRRRRTLLITAAGATLAVLLTAAFLSGLFTYDRPSRDDSVTGGIRAPVPNGSAQDGASPGGRSSGPASASPSRSATPSPDTTPSDSSPAPTEAAATPTAAPSSAGTTPGGTAPEPTDAEGRPPVLRFGDQGPEVVELQLRLRQIGFYGGDADGDYDRTVEGAVRTYQVTRAVLTDESGVYGTATRAALESETSEP